MRIAVTGGTGFIGRYIVNRLLSDGHDVRTWARSTSDRGGFGPEANRKLTIMEGELNNPASTERLVDGCDAVVHAALAWASGGSSDLIDFAQRNIIGSLRLMDASRSAGVGRFVFISTCAVHDRILDDRPLDEAHPLWPYSHYGAHKAAIEKFVHSFGLPKGPDAWPICAIRPTGVYGLRRPVTAGRWVDLIRRVLAGEAIDTAAGGKEVHAADVAEAVALVLQAPGEAVAGEAFNCYDRYVAEQEVARIAAEHAGVRIDIADRNRGPKHQIDTSRLRALGMRFGGTPQLEQYVRDVVAALRQPGAGAA